MTGIGPRLRQERHRLKLSQSALGAAGGVETNAQSNYESGVRSPKVDYLLRIAGVGVDIVYVLTGKRSLDIDADEVAEAEKTDPAINEHLSKVTQQLHRNLHGLIDALSQMSVLIDLRANGTQDTEFKAELNTISTEAQALAQASVRLMFVTSKLS